MEKPKEDRGVTRVALLVMLGFIMMASTVFLSVEHRGIEVSRLRAEAAQLREEGVVKQLELAYVKARVARFASQISRLEANQRYSAEVAATPGFILGEVDLAIKRLWRGVSAGGFSEFLVPHLMAARQGGASQTQIDMRIGEFEKLFVAGRLNFRLAGSNEALFDHQIAWLRGPVR